MARSFYVNLYTKDPTVSFDANTWNFPKLARGTICWLSWEVVANEVKRAVFQLGANKVSGPDGTPTAFFQKFWDWVGYSVTKFVLDWDHACGYESCSDMFTT